MKQNTSLKQLNVSKTELSDKVCDKVEEYLEMSKLKLGKLDLSKNLITDAGFKLLGPGLAENISILQLILDQNSMKSYGCEAISNALCKNKTIKELSISANRINNEGIAMLG